MLTSVRRLPTLVLVGLLTAYRAVISPLYGPTCRYYPSCSAYALQAVRVHGAARGSWLAARRLARCHPWAAGGVDFVPPPRNERPGADVAAAAATTSSAHQPAD